MNRILIVQLRQLGDIILTTPCAREIKKAYPGARVDFWAHRMGRMVLDGNPFIDECLYLDEKNSLREQWAFFRETRSRRYDMVIDFMNNPRSAIGTRLTGGTRRVAFDSARWWAYNERHPRVDQRMYIVREKFALMERAGIWARDESLILPWGRGDAHPARVMTEAGEGDWAAFRDAPFRVVLSPTHRREARRWPLDRYAAIADRLTREWGAAVGWLWGPGEESDVDQAMRLCQTRTWKILPTKFREMACLLANVDLFVGNSNGPSHVAVAAGITSLQIHGPTSAVSWCPMTERHRAVQGAMMEDVGVESTWNALLAMRPVIEDQSKTRRGRGFRDSWDLA